MADSTVLEDSSPVLPAVTSHNAQQNPVILAENVFLFLRKVTAKARKQNFSLKQFETLARCHMFLWEVAAVVETRRKSLIGEPNHKYCNNLQYLQQLRFGIGKVRESGVLN